MLKSSRDVNEATVVGRGEKSLLAKTSDPGSSELRV